MRIYTSETVIEVTDEEINAISNLVSFAKAETKEVSVIVLTELTLSKELKSGRKEI